MTFDPHVPLKLKKTQQWFASIISRPIDEESRMNPISPSGVAMEEEAPLYIAPSPTLRPDERIQIYNQQYWWRLLNTLHDIFPLVTRLFGYHDFNQVIGIPYLYQYPPPDWCLIKIGDHLPDWVEANYEAPDKQLVLDAGRIDCAFNLSFLAPEHERMNPSTSEEAMLSQKLFLQPHIHLFDMDYNLFEFRQEFLKEKPDYWVENDFPNLLREKHYFFVLFRNRKNDLSWNEISEGEYHLLKKFQTGMTIDNACQWLEEQPSIYEKAMSNLHLWFQEWTARGWLTPVK